MVNLFIDTTNYLRTAAVTDESKVISLKQEKNGMDLSSRMLPLIKEAIDNANMVPNDIDNIFVAVGPGSFTGIRIGVTIAKTFAWALNKKIIPISSLEIMASTKTNYDFVVPYIDARRGFAFAGIYDGNLKNLVKDQHILTSDLTKIMNENYAFLSYLEIDTEKKVITPEIDIMRVINNHSLDEAVNPHSCNPVYLKLTEAEEKFHVNI